MTPERWAQIEGVLDGALDLEPSARAAYLAEACGSDGELRAEVERLLDAAETEDGPLGATGDRPAAQWAAPLVARTLGAAIPTPIEMPIPPPSRIGPWRIIEPAGEGGMGTVFLAERDDGAFQMRVALKLVRRGLDADARFVRRFAEERRILARLDHPGIARLLDGGVSADGRPYYVMEFVDGAPIDAWCDARRLSVDARLSLFAKVCDAVAEAHRERIVHRDLKPSNILVTAAGEPKLLDFGIAKLLGTDAAGAEITLSERRAATALTRTGQRLLTPEYASPEQIRGDLVTPASDVHALGLVLYELLTGRRPFGLAGRTPHDVERAILDEEPTRPSSAVTRESGAADVAAPPASAATPLHAERRGTTAERLRQRLRGDLDAIVLTALRKEPTRRYATAGELAEDLRRHLAGRPVLARGDGAAYRARKWVRRHRVSLAAAAFGMVAGVGAIVALGRAAALARDGGDASGAGTRSAAAFASYEEGLRLFARGNFADATGRFQAALAEDSTFAMAAFYGAESARRQEAYPLARQLQRQAVRHAATAPERERLIIFGSEAHRLRAPALRAYADSLLARHPGAVEGPLYAARAAFLAGDFDAAAEGFRRVVAMDSAALVEGRVPCHACEALQQVVIARQWGDSADGALREAERYVALQPQSAAAWRTLATAQLHAGRPADSAYRRVLELDPAAAAWSADWTAESQMRRADFAAADEILRGRLRTAPPGREERTRWLLLTSLRNQRRWPEALAVADSIRVIEAANDPTAAAASGQAPDAAPPVALHVAQVLLEGGRPREAAALYDSVARWRLVGPSEGSSHRIWHLAHRADALAAAGDTSELAALADSIAGLAPASGNGRDRRLADHVRGLLLAARGDDERAAAALRGAVFSWSGGYTRTNLHLARALVRLGRPSAAVRALQPALRGDVEGNNFYLTFTDVHEALAEAWAAAGNADSAAAHRQWVARATGGRAAWLAAPVVAAAPGPVRLVPGAARRVAFDTGLELDPAPSPDGTRLAYASDRDGRMRLYVRPLAGGPPTELATALPGYHRAPRWSPDGRTILFQSGGDLYAVPSSGGTARVVLAAATEGGVASSPAWSPDGREIAYMQSWQVKTRPVAGGAARTIVGVRSYAHLLRWSPDGEWIAYVEGNAAFVYGLQPFGSPVNFGNIAPASIWVVPARGGTPVRVTDESALNTSPVWLPDSRGLLFVSNRDGDRDVYHVTLGDDGRPAAPATRVTAGLGAHTIALTDDGRRLLYSVYRGRSNVWAIPLPASGVATEAQARPVTSGSQTIEGIAVSADGRWLAFDADRAGNQDVYRMPVTGGDPQALTTSRTDDFLPEFSRDGREIAYYTMLPDGKRKILVVPATGGTPQPVVDTPRDQRYPGWSPDGRSLVFNSDALGRQQVYVVSRDRAGRWGPVRQLTRDGGASPRWSPDGRTIAYVRPDGLWTIAARGGTPRQHLRIGAGQGDFLGAVQWSPDGRTLYYKWIDERSRATIQALPLAGGTSRLVVRLEDARRQSLRPEFATDGRHVYLSIAERESDVWVMELGTVRE